MKINMIGSFQRNHPFGTEIAFLKGLQLIGEDVGWLDPSSFHSHNWHDPSQTDALIMFKEHSQEANEMCRVFRDEFGVVVIEYQPDDIRAPGIKDMMKRLRQYCDYAFTFDATGAKVAQEELGYKKARKLIVTADTELYHPLPDVKKDIDFCFIGSLSNPRMHKSRNRMIELLTENGFSVFAQSNFNPEYINQIYNRSKVVLNHATDVGQDFGTGYGYQCRHFEAGFAGSCLFSNKLLDDEPEGPKLYMEFWDEDSLLEWASELLQTSQGSPKPTYEIAAAEYFFELNKKHKPEHRAKEIVQFIEEVRSEA